MENVLGLLGLALIVFVVALWQLGPDWAHLTHQLVTVDKPADEHWCTYWAYYAVALFGAAMTPYEVFFFSSGGVEERWTVDGPRRRCGQRLHRLPARRRAVAGDRRLHGGGLRPARRQRRHPRPGRPAGRRRPRQARAGRRDPRVRRGHVRRRAARPGCRPATASPSTSAGSGASTSGRREASRFHLVLIVVTLLATAVLLTGVDPILVTEVSVVFSRRRPAADVLPDPGGRQRPGLHGRARQRPARQRARDGLPGASSASPPSPRSR